MSKQPFLDDVIEVEHAPGHIKLYHCACYRPGADETVWRMLRLMSDRQCEACGDSVSKPPAAARPIQLNLWSA